MSWLCIRDPRSILPVFPSYGMDDWPELLVKGTLTVEFTQPAMLRRDIAVIRYEREDRWLRSVKLLLRFDGMLKIIMRQGISKTNFRIPLGRPKRPTRMRVSMSWDAPKRIGLLSVEDLETGILQQVDFPNPIPLPKADIFRMLASPGKTGFGPLVSYAAISDRIEPVGLAPGFAAGTQIMTAEGMRPIDTIRRGDLVHTADLGLQPVRWITRRKLPGYGMFAPVQIRRGTYGLFRDITLAADHKVLLTGAPARRHYGQNAALVEARYLGDAVPEHRAGPRLPTQTYVNLLFDTHACVFAGGCWAESLYVGDLKAAPEVLVTTPLAEMPMSALPRHRTIVRSLPKVGALHIPEVARTA
ncbi:MAG: Hint domain-containing protein [Rhodobacteraceae bacterium]|nr:Hint domain-containing protein [Paracoccaceae bacterium]